MVLVSRGLHTAPARYESSGAPDTSPRNMWCSCLNRNSMADYEAPQIYNEDGTFSILIGTIIDSWHADHTASNWTKRRWTNHIQDAHWRALWSPSTRFRGWKPLQPDHLEARLCVGSTRGSRSPSRVFCTGYKVSFLSSMAYTGLILLDTPSSQCYPLTVFCTPQFTTMP